MYGNPISTMSKRNYIIQLISELDAYCNSDSLSEGGLSERIERLTPIGYKFFLAACRNEKVTEGIIRCLLEYFPDAASATDNDSGCTPLHYACSNKNITLNIIQLLIDAAPTTVRHVNNKGRMPLHILCGNKKLDEIIAKEILKLLIEKCPEAVRHANNEGTLPIHRACRSRSPEFCRVLIEAYPGSERMANSIGLLPLHFACFYGTVAVV
jgi:ankyrin repeat protein